MEQIENIEDAIIIDEAIDGEFAEDVPLTAEQLVAQAVASGLRRLADAIEKHPKVAESIRYTLTSAFYIFPEHMRDSGESTAHVLAGLYRWCLRNGGTVTKAVATDKNMTSHLDFGPHIRLKAHVERDEVCSATVVGTEVVEIDDPNWVRPVAPKVKVTRDKIAWECHPVLGARAEIDANEG